MARLLLRFFCCSELSLALFPRGPLATVEPTAASVAANRPMSKLKLAGFVLTLFTIMLLAAEVLVRVGFFVAKDFSMYYISYGFVPDIESHSDQLEGYMKFPPSTSRQTKLSNGRLVQMTINSDGFRGTKDFVKPKPPGTFRIVTLGESSTFGLANPDDETYAAMLEQRIATMVPDRPVEVYNLGIPHFRADNILAAARAELPGLQPDIVTLYAGYNNAFVARSPTELGTIYKLKDWFKYHSVAYRSLHPYVVNAYSKVSGLMQKDVVGLPHMGLPIELTRAQVDHYRAAAREEFAEELDSIIAVVGRSGAELVLITQTFTISRLAGFRIEGSERPYHEEVAFVDSLLEANGKVVAPWSTLLTHNDLMNIVRARAAEHGLLLIEGIEILDKDRLEVMASMVHLTKLGNERLSGAMVQKLDSAGLLPTPNQALARTPRRTLPPSPLAPVRARDTRGRA